jgi:hypothetical protein
MLIQYPTLCILDVASDTSTTTKKGHTGFGPGRGVQGPGKVASFVVLDDKKGHDLWHFYKSIRALHKEAMANFCSAR